MVQVKEQFVSENVVKNRSYGYGNPVDYVITHQTGNTSKGANAEMHARLQSNMNPRQASWHEQVDDKQAIISFDDNVKCWAAGDGRGPGNTRGYHIEICINSDGDYEQAVRNGAERARAKLKEHGLGIDRLKQHADFANKNCPAQLRAGKNGISWDDFVNMVKEDKSESEKPTVIKQPKQQVKPATTKNNSIVDYLNAKKINSSFANRKKLAVKHGIKNYSGTAAQNLQLLNILRSGPKKKPTKPSYVGKRAESKHNGQLRFYNKASWDDKDVAGYLKKGYGFPTIVSKVNVGNAQQYKVKNSKGAVYYVTASSKYIKVV